MVYKTVPEKLPCKGRPDVEYTIIKCAKDRGADRYQAEFDYMQLLRDQPWSVRPREFFMFKDKPCFSMEELNPTISSVRNKFPKGFAWPMPTLVSIAIGMVDAFETIHTQYELSHADFHMGNLATRKIRGSRLPVSTELVLFDYGDMRPAQDNSKHSKNG
jgi:hypothetical protein